MNHFSSMRLAFIGILLLSGIGNLCMPAILQAISLDSSSLDSWSLEVVICGILDGLLIGEFLSIAFWLLLESMTLLRKLLLGSCAGFSLSACLVAGLQVWEGMPRGAAVFIWVVGSLLPFAFAVFLWFWSVLIRTDDLPLRLGAKNSRNTQYGVGFLLFSMFAVAAAIFLIRVSLPSDQDTWFPAGELAAIVMWFVWLVAATSLFAWITVKTIIRSTLFFTGVVVLLSIFGPDCFHFVASMVLPKSFSIQFRLWEPLPHTVAIGLLISALIIGLVCRAWGQISSPPSPDSNEENRLRSSP